jgi:hypothetical protein
LDPIKKSKYLGAVTNEELGKEVVAFVADIKPEIFLGVKCFGYNENLPNALCDRMDIDQNNWLSIISMYDIKTENYVYRLTVFLEELENDYQKD